MTLEEGGRQEDRSGPVGRWLRWLFENRETGRMTVTQWPNISLSVFIILSLALRLIHPTGEARAVLRVLAVAALAVWAIDEMVRGVNPFRRILGLVVSLATAANLLYR